MNEEQYEDRVKRARTRFWIGMVLLFFTVGCIIHLMP